MADMARLFEKMAANKSLKASDYKIYLCLFSRAWDGEICTESYISEITGLHPRTVQKKVREIEKSGRVKREKSGEVLLTFSVIAGSKSGPQAANSQKQAKSDQKNQSVLKQESYNERHVPENTEHKTSIEDLSSSDTRVKSSDPKNEDLNRPSEKKKKADKRFKILVDRLFEIYEKETQTKLNSLFGAADGKMISRLLKNLPDETVDRLCDSFVNFLRTDDDFDALMVTRGPVRYWATRVNAFLPKKQFDVVEGYRKKHGNPKND